MDNMKPRRSSTRTTLPLLLVASLLLLSCGLFATPAGQPANQNETGAGRTPLAPPVAETAQAVETPAEESAPATQSGGGFDVSQAGLPPCIPIYPGAHDFSGTPGIMVQYTADADVTTASAFYDKAMKGCGWSGYSIANGGANIGECGGDCGPVKPTPTITPGPKPTATPPGWVSENFQVWTSGTGQIMIMYTANPHGGTDIVITMTGK
jgi:hypothetical protein